jgi:phenylalanyl-tRNA synthetase alpha chain
MPTPLMPAQLARDLSLAGLSDRRDGPHPIQQLVEQAAAALADAWGCEARWRRGPRIVTVADNYDHLGYPAAAVTRERQRRG